MANYRVGDLEVSLSGIDNGAVASINKVEKALSSLSSILSQINNVENNNVTSLINTINSLGNMQNLDFKWLTSLSTRFTTFSKKMGELDFNSITDGFTKLTTAITPFIDKVQSAQGGLTSLNNVLTQVNSRKLTSITNTLNSGNVRGNNTLNSSVLNFSSTIYVLRNIYRFIGKISTTVSKIVKYGSDYTETLNLWQVSMRDNLDMASEFVTTMNKAYGISEKTLMNSQAIFKNMLSTLGEIDSNTAYLLSESITQMAVDFSSLYNVEIEEAITKFQAMLAGQVRPIRSVSGYDITENTLYETYQQLGGTKAMRSLSQTEKRLLSIYTVLQQMERSGAVGDMSKTLGQWANQSRMLSENWEEFLTYLGLTVKTLLEQTGILTYLNALLITMSEIMKAIAKSAGYVTPDFTDMLETVEDTNDEVDELQGKLLDFDKFRALDESDDETTSIDQQLLSAISGYSSILSSTNNEARELAEQWLEILGFTEGVDDEIYNITEKAKGFITVIEYLLALSISSTILTLISSIKKLGETIGGVTGATQLLTVALVTGIIFAVLKAIEAFKEGDTWGGVLAITLGVVLLSALIALKSGVDGLFKSVSLSLALGVAVFTILDSIISGLDGTAKKIVSWASIVVGAIMTVVAVVATLKGITGAWRLPVLLAGIGAIIAGVKGLTPSVTAYAEGGVPDKGTMFLAGESGAEIVYNNANGDSGVVNVQQIQQAMYNALVQYGKQGDGNIQVTVNLDGEKVYQNTTNRAKARGNVWAKA